MMNTQEFTEALETALADVTKLTFDECKALLTLDEELNPVVTNPTSSYQSIYAKLLVINSKDEKTENDERFYNTLTTAIEKQERQCLQILPEEMIERIGRFLEPNSIARNALGQTCSQNHRLFLFKRNALALKKAEMELWHHVVRGEQAKAERIIEAFPCLLTRTRKVTDYSGREIQGTVLRIALGAVDVKFHENEECMVEMIQKHMRQLPDGESIMAAQIRDQFPEGWEAEEVTRVQKDRDALHAVINAITQSGDNDDCETAIQAFRNHLDKQTHSVIKTGKHFNWQLLDEAASLYDTNYDAFGGWDSRKNNLYWRKVIGGIQRYFPAWMGQACCQGYYNIVEAGAVLSRSLNFRYGGGSFYPLDQDPRLILGRDFAGAGPFHGVAWAGCYRTLPYLWF